MAEIKEDEKTINSLPMTGVVKAIQVKWPGVPLVTSAELEKMIQDSKDGLKNLVVYVSNWKIDIYCLCLILQLILTSKSGVIWGVQTDTEFN